MTKTVASAHARIDVLKEEQDGHERLCAERYRNIDEKMTDLKVGLKWVITLMIAALISTAGFGLNAVYEDLKTPDEVRQ